MCELILAQTTTKISSIDANGDILVKTYGGYMHVLRNFDVLLVCDGAKSIQVGTLKLINEISATPIQFVHARHGSRLGNMAGVVSFFEHPQGYTPQPNLCGSYRSSEMFNNSQVPVELHYFANRQDTHTCKTHAVCTCALTRVCRSYSVVAMALADSHYIDFLTNMDSMGNQITDALLPQSLQSANAVVTPASQLPDNSEYTISYVNATHATGSPKQTKQTKQTANEPNEPNDTNDTNDTNVEPSFVHGVLNLQQTLLTNENQQFVKKQAESFFQQRGSSPFALRMRACALVRVRACANDRTAASLVKLENWTEF